MLGCFALLAGCSGTTTASPSLDSATQQSAVATPTSTVTVGTQTVTVGLNQAAQLGPLSYTVTGVEDLGNTLESPQGGSLTQGTFIAATVRAQNTAARPFRLWPENFSATTSGGQTVRANLNDSIVANGNDPKFNAPIANGQVVVGRVIFNFETKPAGSVSKITIKDPAGGTVLVTVT